MRVRSLFLLPMCAAFLGCVFGATALLAEEPRPNIVMIAVDDLRPELGCYGRKAVHSPSIDRLAATGVTFMHAYCMVPTCGASRASLMTGMRPSPNRFVTYQARADRDAPGIVTLNSFLKKHGYRTISNGKVFHFPKDNAAGWSETPWRPRGTPTYAREANCKLARERGRERGRGPPFESADVPDNTYRDGQLADKTIDDLRRLKRMGRPFFLAVGFFKPHLPFVAPQKYWDLYDPESIRLPDNYFAPDGAPEVALHNFGELRKYAGVPRQGPLPEDLARTLIRGYHACVSYTDAQVGKVLDELERLGLAADTIVVLWGDHGWQLGEHGLWCKHCTFETSMRAPLIVRAPGRVRGRTTGGLTEFIDIYPSLCELAGLPPPEHLQGMSFVPLLEDPSRKWKAAAIGRYRSGDTIRTARYRYSEYTDPQGNVLGRMLYDHVRDPDENVNVAAQPKRRGVVEDLARQLGQGKGRDDALNTVAGKGAPAGVARIRPYRDNPSYWEYRGKPVLLVGGSKDDNLFQLPDLKEHLDDMKRAGGNYVRNTMSDRPDKGFEVYPFRRLSSGKYDLGKWNDEYWARFERFLKLTHERDIFVQIELWDRFDYTDSRGSGRWSRHPYNPKNNVNYTAAESGLKLTYKKHPGANEQPFFYTVPALRNNKVVLRYQQAQVEKMLSYALKYGHVLYCMDNETSGSPEWGKYWSGFIRERARKAGVEVHTTEMWDAWDPKGGAHKRTFDHPELYSFVDVSQNNHNKGQVHWDNLQWVRRYISMSSAPRPINTVKIYGADGGRFGNSRDGEERFWRNILGGAASTRFHRPDAGIGLSERGKAHIHSLRLLTAELDIFKCTPDAPSRLLSGRRENEAYATYIAGRQYAVYFPDGGEVELDLSGAKGKFASKWLNIGESRWQGAASFEGGDHVDLRTPGKGHWAVFLTRVE